MPRPPVVAIVGRPNVGKSSLLNALAKKRISIVQDMPGVTRDRISTPLLVGDRFVELMDTGGYGFVDAGEMTEHIKHQIELAMAQANLVLFIVDAQAGLTSADEEIASLLRRKGIKTALVANKADGPRVDSNLGDFARLGLGTPLGVSATSDRNLEQLSELIAKNVDLSNAPTEMPEPQIRVAIVGKRNAGKSTLVNAVAEIFEGTGDRVIVSEVPGTTRDSVDVRFEKEGKTLIVIDTAGVRKKRHMVTDDIEFYSFHRAQRSIRRADVVIQLIDGMEPISEPDKKLAAYIAEQMKPVILVVNKWDLVLESAGKKALELKTAASPDLLMDEYREYLDQDLPSLSYAPVAFLTAKDKRNVQVVVDLAQKLFKQANERISTSKLNEALEKIMEERKPSTASGRRARIYYATQPEVAPPTIVLFVNKAAYFVDSYKRYMINRFRELLPYSEVPIKLIIRGRDARTPAPEKIIDGVDEHRRPVKSRPVKAGSAKTRTRRQSSSAKVKRPPLKTKRPKSAPR